MISISMTDSILGIEKRDEPIFLLLEMESAESNIVGPANECFAVEQKAGYLKLPLITPFLGTAEAPDVSMSKKLQYKSDDLKANHYLSEVL
jgi:hypothetical protein